MPGFNGLITSRIPSISAPSPLAGTLNGAGAGFAKGTARITLQPRNLVTGAFVQGGPKAGRQARGGGRSFVSARRLNATSPIFWRPSQQPSAPGGETRRRARRRSEHDFYQAHIDHSHRPADGSAASAGDDGHAAAHLLLVRVMCSDGIEGVGEATSIGGLAYGDESPEGVKVCIDTFVAPAMQGTEATNINAPWSASGASCKAIPSPRLRSKRRCSMRMANGAWSRRRVVGRRGAHHAAGAVDAGER